MKNKEQPFSVFHYLNSLNLAMLIIPISSIIASLLVYYIFNKNRLLFLPSESDFSIQRIEGRISTILNSLEIAIISIMLFIRHRVIDILKASSEKSQKLHNIIFYWTMRISAYTAIAGRLTSLFCSLDQNRGVHLIGLNVMCYSFSLYLILNDTLCKSFGYECKKPSQILSYLYVSCVLVFFAMRFYSPKSKEKEYSNKNRDVFDFINFSVSSFFGIVASIVLAIKLYLMKFDIPEYGVRLMKRITC